jgi:hypothetical protein
MTQSIISLLMGMKFFRVKMVPFEDFEHSFQVFALVDLCLKSFGMVFSNHLKTGHMSAFRMAMAAIFFDHLKAGPVFEWLSIA